MADNIEQLIDSQMGITASPVESSIDEQMQQEQYGTPIEMAKTVGEGVLQGALGPVGTAIAQGYGSDPQAMRERASANPITHALSEIGGFAGSFGVGAGVGPVTSAIGKGVEAASGLGKVLGGGTRLATEMGLISAGDEISKMMTHDPDQSLGSAATNVGLSSLLGLGGGAALSGASSLLKATAGNKINQFLEDFKGRINYHINNPNPVETLQQELGDHYQAVKSMADDVFGPSGLKAQDIAKAVPESHAGMLEQVGKIENKLGDALETMRAKPELYPPHLTAQLEDWQKIYKEGVEGQFKNPTDYFNSIQELKQRMQSIAKYGSRIPSIAPEYKFVSTVREMASGLKDALEDSSVWGKAAKRQSDINKAFTEFLPSLKDFEKKFTTELNGERVIDPTKINTYVNQLGKPGAELKKEMLENFLSSSERYKNVVDKSHANLGLDAPEWNTSLALAKESLEDLPAGAHMADALVKRGLAKFGGRALGAGIGAGAGRFMGMSGIGAIVGEHTLGPLLESILPALTKPILEGQSSAEGLKGAIDYGMAVVKGDRLLTQAAKNIFKKGSADLPSHIMPTEKTLEKLDKGLKAAQNDPQQMFSTGNSMAHYLPNHTAAAADTAVRVVDVLNKMRPKTDPQYPLDDDREPDRIEEAKYKKALTIAEQPASVLSNISDGSLTPGDVAMLSMIHPGAYANMKNKIVAEMADYVSRGETIPFRTQMSLSVFLGQPLTEALRPINMASNQIVGKPQQQEQSPSPERARNAPKGQKSALQKLSGMYNTPIQAREREKNSA